MGRAPMLVGWVHLDTSLARGGDRLREECGDKFPDLSESLFIVDMRHEWAEACALLVSCRAGRFEGMTVDGDEPNKSAKRPEARQRRSL